MPVIWLTGLSGAGKSTLAAALIARLHGAGHASARLLESEDIRARLPRVYGHGLEDRAEVLRHVVRIAAEEQALGHDPVVATISHQRWMRDLARERLGAVLDVHVACPPEVCAARDPKGHYHAARTGAYECFVGVTHPYEPGGHDLVLPTATAEVSQTMEVLWPVAARHLGLT